MSIRILIAGYAFTLFAAMLGCLVIARTRHATRGLWWIVGAFFSGMVGMLCFAGIGYLPNFFTIVLANEAMLIGFVLLHQAVASVLQSRHRYAGLGILLALTQLLLCVHFTYIVPDMQARTIGRVSLVAVQVALSALTLFRHKDRALRFETRIAGWAFALFAALQASNLVTLFFWPPLGDRLHPRPVQAFYHVFNFMVAMGCCFSVVWVALSEQRHGLQVMATTDRLSGLMNRGTFDATLERDMRRRRSRPLALLLIDLDHFKNINDRHGHQMGDDVIRRVSRLLHDSIRPLDSVARYGGEEFAVILRGMRFEQAEAVAERLRCLVQESSSSPGAILVTASIGIAMRREDDSVESLFKRADEALYLSKRLGRNRVSALEYTFEEP